MKEITETCSQRKGFCEIQVIETAEPKPKNIRIGCVTHHTFLPEQQVTCDGNNLPFFS